MGHDVPGRFGQFAAQRLGRDDRARLGRLPVGPAPAVFIVAPGKIGGLDKGPSQILVAAFGVVVRLFLPLLKWLASTSRQ